MALEEPELLGTAETVSRSTALLLALAGATFVTIAKTKNNAKTRLSLRHCLFIEGVKWPLLQITKLTGLA